MNEPSKNQGWISWLLSQRDGAFALDTLRSLAGDADRPDLSEAERELVSRADPVCDLAVATFGHDASSVRETFTRQASPWHRRAALANHYCSAKGWGGTVLTLDEATTILDAGDVDDLVALFSNRALTPEGLLDVFENTGPATQLAAAHPAWVGIFSGLAKNRAIGDLFDTRRILPAAASRCHMHVALADRIRQLKPTQEVAGPLGEMLVEILDSRSRASVFSIRRDYLDIVTHWHPTAASDASASPYFKVQLMVAILYGQKPQEVNVPTFHALQAAAVAMARLDTPEVLQKAADEHGYSFFAGAVYNPWLYESPVIGSTFMSIAMSADESAVAMYLTRRTKFDRLWGLDRTVTIRDLDRFKDMIRRDLVSRPSAKEQEQLATQLSDAIQSDRRSRADRFRLPEPQSKTSWRKVAFLAIGIILLLLLLQFLQIHHSMPVQP
jgi:hypothetical protein